MRSKPVSCTRCWTAAESAGVVLPAFGSRLLESMRMTPVWHMARARHGRRAQVTHPCATLCQAGVRTQQRGGHLRKQLWRLVLEPVRHQRAARCDARPLGIVKRNDAAIARDSGALPAVLVVVHDFHHALHAQAPPPKHSTV